MKKVLLTLLLSFGLVASVDARMPKTVMTTTHRIEMHVTDPILGDSGDICSSTAVAPYTLLTASHCDLGASTVLVDGNPAAILNRIADGNDHTFYVVNIHFANYSKFSKDTLRPGDEVWLRGNPDGLNQLVRHGVYSGVVELEGQTVQMFDLNGWHGDSGSAIFNEHGQIVAVTTYGFSDGGFCMLGTLQLRFTKEQLNKASI